MLNFPNHARQSQYKIYSNKLNTLIRIAERNYYDERFDLAKNNLKDTWKIINEVIDKSKRKSSLPNTFNHGNKTLSDPLEIANQFCEYFTNVGPNLAKKIPLVDIPFLILLNFLTSVSPLSQANQLDLMI